MRRVLGAILVLALSGCTSIVATCDHPRPFAGCRAYAGDMDMPGFRPSDSAFWVLEAPFTFLMDACLLPYTWDKPVPEPEVEEAW